MSASNCTACLTFDFDGMTAWVTTAKSNNPSMISRGEFAVVGMNRVLDLLRRHEVSATFFVPGHTVLAFPSIVERIRDDGHELGHHGWAHENPSDFDRSEERRILDLGIAALDQVAGVRPAGYRSPAWALTAHSVELLLDADFLYESSCMAADFYPYYLRTGDRWSTHEPYRFGPTSPLVEMPVSWVLDDFPHFELLRGVYNQIAPPEKVYGIWQGEFDYMADHCPDGVFTLTMHPECIGRAHRVPGLERLIEHMRERGAGFETLGAVARRWRTANPLDAWKAANPERTGQHAVQSLDELDIPSTRVVSAEH